MKYRVNQFDRVSVTTLLGVLFGAICVGCASADPDGAPVGSKASALSCGSAVGGTHASLSSYYTYPAQPLNVDCAAPGASISVFVSANDVPNRFTIRDGQNSPVAVSAWLGTAAYSGPWGGSLSNSGTASLSFSNSNGPYSITVETLTPPNGSYPNSTDVWSATPSCQCAATQRHYTCGFAMRGYGCDNGRSHLDVTAADMSAAITACRSSGLPGYPDFCYVIDRDGAVSSDVSECSAASASWRAGNNCCNIQGTKSCPN